MTTIAPDDGTSRRRWARAQVLAAFVCLIPLLGYAHMYVAHESDDVIITRWAAYVVVLSVIWGPVPIGAAGFLGFAAHTRRVGVILGALGALAAGVFYLGGLWVFTFRYPPHLALYVAEVLGALGSILAIAAAVVQARMFLRPKVV